MKLSKIQKKMLNMVMDETRMQSPRPFFTAQSQRILGKQIVPGGIVKIKECWALSNLRPLEAKYNVLKSDMLEISHNNFIKFVSYA